MLTSTEVEVKEIMIVRQGNFYFHNTYDGRGQTIISAAPITLERAKQIIEHPENRIKHQTNEVTYQMGSCEWSVTLEV